MNVGDKIVYSRGLTNSTLHKAIITKSLKTQITTDTGVRFLKSTGKMVGASKIGYPYIITNLTWEEADEINEQRQIQKVKTKLKDEIYTLIRNNSNIFGDCFYSIETLEKIIELLKGEIEK